MRQRPKPCPPKPPYQPSPRHRRLRGMAAPTRPARGLGLTWSRRKKRYDNLRNGSGDSLSSAGHAVYIGENHRSD